jgi:hypothetical protein
MHVDRDRVPDDVRASELHRVRCQTLVRRRDATAGNVILPNDVDWLIV